LAERGFAFAERRVREVMQPRPLINFITADATAQQAARYAVEMGRTRLPVCERDAGLDAPLGLIHAHDLLAAIVQPRDVPVLELLRPLYRVSEGMLVTELLTRMRREHSHMALVADEHGTTIGLVTLEDLLEELVGEIEDEVDPEPPAEQIRRSGDDLAVSGSTPLQTVSSQLGLTVIDPHADTIGGHLIELLGRMPANGETLRIDGWTVTVTEVDDARITGLLFHQD
jgi:CBS domain containing-hemolysin-like protein